MYRPTYAKHNLKQIRSFTRVMAVFFAVLALLVVWRNDFGMPTRAQILAGIAAFWLSAGLFVPAALKPLYHLWMWLAFGLNFVSSRIILTLLFFGLILPMAMIMKVVGKDPFDRKRRESYWKTVKTQAPSDHFERLYTLSDVDDGS